MEIAIGVITYRRPHELGELLESIAQLAAPADARLTVVVVDNDADGSAKQIAADWQAPQGWNVTYDVEPTPGIAAARNRVLELAKSHDYLAFVDDDETVDVNWLTSLVATQRATGSTGVSGPVDYQFVGRPRRWIEQGGFFDNPTVPDEGRMTHAASNNLLLDVKALDRLGIGGFDPSYGLTGGSDSDFTRRIVLAGGSVVWCAAAVVRTRVPTDRLTGRWVLTRARRTGNTTARIELIAAADRRILPRVTVFVSGLARVMVGGAEASLGMATGNARRVGRGLRRTMRGYGLVEGAMGRYVNEYSRAQYPR